MLDIRLQRVARRDRVSRELIERRIQNQMPDEEKRDRSDYVVINDEKQALIPQVEKFLADYGLFVPKLC